MAIRSIGIVLSNLLFPLSAVNWPIVPTEIRPTEAGGSRPGPANSGIEPQQPSEEGIKNPKSSAFAGYLERFGLILDRSNVLTNTGEKASD